MLINNKQGLGLKTMNRTSSTSAIRRIVLDAGLVIVATLVSFLVILSYAQTVSAAAPANHSDFSDLEAESNLFHAYFDYLIDEGVLRYDTGCVDTATAPEGLCPGEGMPRWQAAVVIARALNDGDDPDDPTTATFADVDIDDSDIWWAPHVEFIYEEEVTVGCGENEGGDKLFCPERNTTRAEMATFLKRAFDVPESDMEDVFADVVVGTPHAPAIDDIADEEVRITHGCGWAQAGVASEEDHVADGSPRYYCPDDSRQDQLLALLARAMRWQAGLETNLDDPAAEEGGAAANANNDADANDGGSAVDGSKGPAGGKGEKVADLGPGTHDDLLLGSLFIGLVTASIICSRIYLDARKRQNNSRSGLA